MAAAAARDPDVGFPGPSFVADGSGRPLSRSGSIQDWPVGFTIRGGAGRRVWLWYPAARLVGERFTLRDYLIEPFGATPSDRGITGFRRSVTAVATLSDDQLSRLLATEMPVSRDAPSASGRFPVVLLGTGLNAPGYLLTETAEFLARRGYIVAGAPSHGAREGEALAFDTTGVVALVALLNQARATAAAHPGADTSRLAVVAWSVGGVAGSAFAVRRGGVGALVSLDSGIEYRYGDSLLTAMAVDSRCLRAPRLHLIAGGPPRVEVPRSRRVFDEPSLGAAYRLTVPELTHGEFTGPFGLRGAAVHDAARRRVQRGQRRVEDALAGFLGRYLDGSRDTAAFEVSGLGRRAADSAVSCPSR
ncbi:MAG: dienelactone hydrolase family protein [Gemmatimonadales bacterium]